MKRKAIGALIIVGAILFVVLCHQLLAWEIGRLLNEWNQGNWYVVVCTVVLCLVMYLHMREQNRPCKNTMDDESPMLTGTNDDRAGR